MRAWGIVNWPAERVAEAGRVARELGVAPPCAAQLPYSLIARDWVESPEMTEALLACGAKVVASYVLAGGILSGKYAAGACGRMAGEVDAPRWEGAVRAARELAALAAEVGTTPAVLAMAFVLTNSLVATDPLRRDLARADPRERRGRRRGRRASPRASSSGCGRSGSDRLRAAALRAGRVLIGLGVRLASTRR